MASREVTRSAAESAGIMPMGLPDWNRLWDLLEPEVVRLEQRGVPEQAITSFVRAVVEGVAARRRFDAALKAKARR